MASVSGTYRLNEVLPVMPELQRRMYGRSNANRVLLLVGVAAIWALGFNIWGWISWDTLSVGKLWFNSESAPSWIFSIDHFIRDVIGSRLFGGLLMLCLGLLVIGRAERANQGYATLEERGISGLIPWTTTLSPEAMIADDGDVRRIIKWRAVSELFPFRDYWIFVVQTGCDIVDRRSFANADAEREFIAEALSHMSEAARVRSKDAVNFASGAI